MALIRSIQGKSPQLGKDVWLAENATVIGEVALGDGCSVWYNAVIRGDVHWIKVGEQTNIQDGAILHCTYQQAPLSIGRRVSIGHSAIVHGCTVDERVLIGMGAKVLDHAHVPSDVIVAAGALVLERQQLESGYLYAGVPARKVKPLTDKQREMVAKLPDHYTMYASWFAVGE